MLDYVAIIRTPLPDVRLGILQGGAGVRAIDFLPGSAAPLAPRSAVARRAVEALQGYFTDPRHAFSLPLEMGGTAFQRRVWQALTRLPPGRTVTYGELARRLDSGARAVAGACRANPIPLVVPCHRVVAATGLGGYGGQVDGHPLQIKRWLLGHEQRAVG